MELLTQKKSPLFLAILKKLLSIHLDDKTDIFHLSVLNVVKDFVNAFPDEAFEFFKENPSPRAISKLLDVSSKLSAEQKEELLQICCKQNEKFLLDFLKIVHNSEENCLDPALKKKLQVLLCDNNSRLSKKIK